MFRHADKSHGDVTRLCYVLSAARKQHARLNGILKTELSIKTLLTFYDPEEA